MRSFVPYTLPYYSCYRIKYEQIIMNLTSQEIKFSFTCVLLLIKSVDFLIAEVYMEL